MSHRFPQPSLPPLRIMLPCMLCTMHINATRHCGLRCKGGKRAKAPRNEELYVFLFGKKPAVRLHSALPDCHVTLTSFVEGRKRKWW